MRGFTKAAALLSSTFALSIPIQDGSPLSVTASNSLIEYRPAEALLRFITAGTQASGEKPTLTFQVDVADKACGESNIHLNGQQLVSEWDGSHAAGSGYLDHVFSQGTYVSWEIVCLFDSIPADGMSMNGKDLAQVLTFLVHSTSGHVLPGFTISFKQLDTPAIIQFSPIAVSVANIQEDAEHWRNPSVGVSGIPTALIAVEEDPTVKERFEPANSGQKSLQAQVQDVGRFMETKIKAIGSSVVKIVLSCGQHIHQHLHDLCPEKSHSQPNPSKFLSGSPAKIGAQTDGQTEHDELNQFGVLTEAPSQNDTRSITTSNTLDPSPGLRPLSAPKLPTLDPSRLLNLQILGLCLILFSLITWIFIRLRDPRRRADRAARREECRNRCLYRRAALNQKWRNWFCSIRHHNHPTIRAHDIVDGGWDEKRTRVLRQEGILEEVMKDNIRSIQHTYMKDNIRAVRNAHRVESHVIAAEEGRTDFIYGTDNRSERRRSRDTLPGYESEGTQPPSYDYTTTSCQEMSVRDGFLYTPAGSEDTPDSSVISTSPRTSRDGRDSDYGKDFEPLALD